MRMLGKTVQGQPTGVVSFVLGGGLKVTQWSHALSTGPPWTGLTPPPTRRSTGDVSLVDNLYYHDHSNNDLQGPVEYRTHKVTGCSFSFPNKLGTYAYGLIRIILTPILIPVQLWVICNSTSKRAKNVRLSEMVIRHHPLYQLGLRATGEITRNPRLSMMDLSISTVSGLSPTTSADH